MDTEQNTRRDLQVLEAHLARLHEQSRRVEGERDRLLLRLADNDGAADARRVAVR